MLSTGLSPRGRGNRLTAMPLRWYFDPGSIPAWAGEPPLLFGCDQANLGKVYPRVGGGTGRFKPARKRYWPEVYPRVGGGT